MKNDKSQKPKSVVARIAPLLYSNVTLCTVLALGVVAMKAPHAGGD